MVSDPNGDDRTYHVVINDEDQYSIWLDGKTIPFGWRAVGKTGSKQECLAFIDALWVDMRPRRLRIAIDTDARADA